MGTIGAPEWLIREDASQSVLLALYLRQVLGLRSPDELPYLRGIPPRSNDRPDDVQALLERQWREYWAMTVEPQAHPSPVPLDLVEGFAIEGAGCRGHRRFAMRVCGESVESLTSETPPGGDEFGRDALIHETVGIVLAQHRAQNIGTRS